MEPFIDQIAKFSDPAHVIATSQLVISLLLAFLLSLIAAKTYEVTYRGVSFSSAFMHTLVICGMVIAAVMLIIGSNIARAFSLVGALSIIRFRNAVKDPRDVAYIFLTMAIGMACGTGFYQVGIGLTLIICSVSLIMFWTGFGKTGLSERILRIQAPASDDCSRIFEETLRRHSKQHSLLSIQSSRMGTEMELTFLLRVGKHFEVQNLLKELSQINNNLKVEVSGSDHVLEL